MLALLLAPAALADDPAEAWAVERAPDLVPPPAEPETGFRFLGTLTVKASATDVGTTNPLLNGQVVGTLGGTNTTATGEDLASYTEQRAVGLLSWTPPALGGRMTLSTGFEVDFGWGDQSYSVGGNTGGAFGADQVNLQTRRLNASFALGKKTKLVAGLQFVGDGATDPQASRLDDLTRSGGRLLFWGSDATGVAAYGKGWFDQLDWKLGGFTLYESAFASPDDVTLWMLDTRWHPAYATTVGLHGWYLRDRSEGSAGALGTGPTSVLSEMQGGPRLDLRLDPEGAAPPVSAALGWVGVDVGHNAALDKGRVGGSAVAVVNLGRLYVKDLPDHSVAGWLVDAEGRWRWAPGQGSVARIEAIASSRDAEGGDYGGIVTGNSYGIAGATWATHGCMLLYPDLLSINRHVALVYDSSNSGRGQLGLTGSLGWDAVPNRLTVQVGAGHARDGAGAAMGTELNARVVGRPYPLATLGLYGAVLTGSPLDPAPWMTYLAYDQVVF